MPTRWPSRARGRTGGEVEPDARFTLAAERTYLAWLRTSLALLAAGVALEALRAPVVPELRLAAALVLVVLGVLVPVHALVSWWRVEKALRRGQPLPSVRLAALLAPGVAVAGLLVLLGLLLR